MKAQSGVAMEERMSILPAASSVCGGVPSSRDWAGVWKERACEEEEGKEGGLRSKWLSAGSKLARLVPLTWLFLGF